MRFFRFIIKIFFVTFILFILLEVSFRIYDQIKPSYIFPKNNYDRYRGIPNSKDWYGFKLNSQGFADVDYSIKKPDDAIRILCIGDSFLWGAVPYENNFLTLLENDLNSKSTKSIEVINMGISSIGPKDYSEILIHEGLKYQPDFVFCFYFIGNDWIKGEHIANYSYVLMFFKFLGKVIPALLGSEQLKHQVYFDNEKTFDDKTYFNILLDKEAAFKRNASSIQNQVRLSVSHLAKMDQICKKNKIEFVAVVIPDELQIYNDLQDMFIEKSETLTQENADFSSINYCVIKYLEEQNIRYLDLTEYFKESNSTSLYKPNDTHWNIAGNKLASKVIFQYIEENFPIIF